MMTRAIDGTIYRWGYVYKVGVLELGCNIDISNRGCHRRMKTLLGNYYLRCPWFWCEESRFPITLVSYSMCAQLDDLTT